MYMRKTACYTWTDYRTNTEIANDLQKELDTTGKQTAASKRVTQHNERNCTPKGRRNQRRQRRDFWMCETGTGQQVAQLHDDD
jgi:hypothetical protein